MVGTCHRCFDDPHQRDLKVEGQKLLIPCAYYEKIIIHICVTMFCTAVQLKVYSIFMNVNVYSSLLMAHIFMISFHLKVESRFGVGTVARKTKYQEFKSLSCPSISVGKVIIWFKCGFKHSYCFYIAPWRYLVYKRA